MSDLPVIDTALEGFRLTRERPAAVMAWGLVLATGQAASVAVLIGTGAGAVMEGAHLGAPVADPNEAAARLTVMATALPGVALAALVSLAANAVVLTAILRAVLTPAESGALYLRLGLQEGRQFALALGVGLLLWLGWSVLAALLLATLGGLSAVGGATGGAAPLVFALATAAAAYPAARLSLAPALTFADGGLRLKAAWPLTAGRVWRLSAIGATSVMLALVVSVMASLLLVSVWGLVTGRGMAEAAALMRPDLASWPGFLSPPALVALLFNGVLNALVIVVLFAPAPAAFRTLTGRA